MRGSGRKVKGLFRVLCYGYGNPSLLKTVPATGQPYERRLQSRFQSDPDRVTVVSIEPEASKLKTSDTPERSDTAFERPSPRVCIVWLASRSTFWMIVITGLVIARSFGLLSAEAWAIWVFSPSLAWLIPPAHIILRLLPYKGWGYQLRQHDLLVRRGVITVEYISVPLARVQQVDTSSSLFERLLGLTTLVVRTAGTRAARTRIPGLLTETATALRDELSRKGNELAQ